MELLNTPSPNAKKIVLDDSNNLNSLLPENSSSKNKTIIADRGVINKNKIILEKGVIQSFEDDNTVKIIQFNKTIVNFEKLDNRVIKDVKIQETSTLKILSCLKNHYYNKISEAYVKNCPKNNIGIVIETFARRVLMPFYIPLVSILISFMLIYTKNKRTKILNRYIFFLLSFILLVLSELLVRYSGISKIGFYTYLLTPFLLLPIVYLILISRFWKELR